MHILPQNNVSDKTVNLSERLLAIAESLPKNAVVCDVGSDHGILPFYLLKNAGFSKVIVTDLNPLPLERAKQNLSRGGVDDKAVFVLADGIEDVLELSPDVFVIAGMGGETISGILERAKEKIPVGKRFVLQPMTRVETLRRFLYESGFCITNEKVIFENKKFFPIIWCEHDKIARFEKVKNSFLGEFLPLDRGEPTKLYFERLLMQIDNKIRGKKKAFSSIDKEEKQRELLLSLLKEFI